MLLCTVCIAQTKSVEIIHLKGSTMDFEYRKITEKKSEDNFIRIKPVDFDQISYPFHGGIYYSPTKIEGNVQDAADEVLKKYPNEKLPEKLYTQIYFTLQKETVSVDYSYYSRDLNLISPYFIEDLTKAILKNQKLIEIKKISDAQPEIPIKGISIYESVKLR